MDTRLARKRRWTSPEKINARTSLNFTENTPPSKRLRDSSTDSDEEESQFTVKLFYGRREKKSFPHSPSRRKAATKIIDKLNDDEEEFTLRKQVPGEILKVNNKVKKDVFKLSSTSSDSEPVEVLKERKRNTRLNVNKISPKSAENKTSQRKTAKKGSPDITKKKSPVNNKTKVSISDKKCPSTPVSELANINTSESDKNIPGRKFFKSKSPASASKALSSIIVSRGFNLKFLPRRRSLSSLPKQSPSEKTMKKSETKEVFDDSESRNSDSHETQAVVNGSLEIGSKDVNSSQDSGFDSKPSDLSSQNTPTKSSRKTIQRSLDSPRTRSSVVNSPASQKKKNKALNLSPEKQSDTVSCDVSADLFADSNKNDLSQAGSETNEVSDIVSETGSEMSGPSDRSDRKYFPIFNGTSKTSPTVKPNVSQTLRRRSSPRQSPRIRSRLGKDNKEQMVLDAGQKKFGAVQCEFCGMVYRHADPSDEATHEKFHQDLLNVLKFPGWKKERVVQEFSEDCSRIIMVLHDDAKYAVKKIEDINNIMGQEMGFPEASLTFRSKYKAFLYISEDKKVVGCCIAEPVQQGYRVLLNSQPSQSDNPQQGHRPWYCHADSEPAAVGISKIWVFGQQRRKGIATKLLDAVRQWFEYGVYIEKNQVAFSDPTSDGRQLASKYTGTPAFLVYKYS